MLILIATINFFAEAYTLSLPYLVKVSLDLNGDWYSAVISIEAIGGIAGGLLLALFNQKSGKNGYYIDVLLLALSILIPGIFREFILRYFLPRLSMASLVRDSMPRYSPRYS